MPYAVSSEERVNGYTDSRQSASRTLALPDGGYLIVWSGSGPGDLGYGVFLQRYDAHGQRIGDQVLVNTTTVYSQRHPEVTLLASGGYAVTWDNTVPGGQAGDAAALGVFVQVFDAAGVRVGAETQVSGVGHSQQVVALPDGGYVVTWVQHADAPWSGVLAQRFDAGGQALGLPWVLDEDTDATLVDLAATDAGFIAVWRAWNEDGATIAVQAFAADGARLGETVHVPRDNDATAPEIVALIDGGFALVWFEADGLYARILDEAGRTSGERLLVQAAPPGVQLLHSIVATPDGGFTVAWEQFAGSGSVIVEARAFFGDGRPNGDTFNIRKTGSAPGEPPGLTTLASGEVVLTYARYVGDVTGFYDVFQVRLSPLVPTTRGSESDDQLAGAARADRVMGLDGDDALFGVDGDDVLVGGLGDDVLDGGTGRDEAVFSGAAADYRIFGEPGGAWRVKGPDGSDLLIGVELLSFADRTIDLSLIVCNPGDAIPADGGPQVLPADDVIPGVLPPDKDSSPPLVLPDLEPVAPRRWISGAERPHALEDPLHDHVLEPPGWTEWGW